MAVELSKLYKKYQENIQESRKEYENELIKFADLLQQEWNICLKENVLSYLPIFESPDHRLNIREFARRFFGTSDTELSFAAIDGSCDIEKGDRFMSVYGGAYASRGTMQIEGIKGRLVYRRNLDRDISYVTFLPIPPLAINYSVEQVDPESDSPIGPIAALSDKEVRTLSVIQTRLMDLAESYAAYDLARATQEYPNLILMDRTLSGWLGNTSFVELVRSIVDKEILGEKLSISDLYYSVAHPFNTRLKVPSNIIWLPHNKIFSNAYDENKIEVEYNDIKDKILKEVFTRAGNVIKENKIGDYDELKNIITLYENPRKSWEKMEKLYDKLCKELFEGKNWEAIKCIKDGFTTYITSRELQFLSGIGLRLLIERCWQKKILLIGIVKDSSSRYFFRNYLGTIHVEKGISPGLHTNPGFSDRTILETLPYVLEEESELKSPWSTIEFDSCFMTILPQLDSEWKVRGYLRAGQEYTRPPRLFLKWLAQFLVTKNTSSHVIFIDRLAYPGWDDSDSEDIDLTTLGSRLGEIFPLRYSKPSRLNQLSMFLLNTLVKNHFPEAVGYPDPLHKADLAAVAFRTQISRILTSSGLMDKANPLTQTFREIRKRIRSRRK